MPKFNFVGNRKIFFSISAILIFLSIALSLVLGVEIDVEFKGGTLINYSYDGTIDMDVLDAKIEENISSKVSVTQGKDFSTGKNTIQVSFVSEEGLTADKQFELTQALQGVFTDNNLELISSSDVNPSSGRDFLNKCLVAVAFAFILLILYIAWRFKRISGLSAGVMAIVALMHDVLMVYAAFVVFRFPINANFMAVVLTILGYSINDTIVIYDRIRENKNLLGKKTPIGELVNTSINQSLTRSIHTSVCTVVSMLIVSVVAVIFNVESILSFSIPMTIGIISGAYSTICIAGPLWVLWQEHKEKRRAN